MEDLNKEVIKEGAEKVEQGVEKSNETAEQFKSRIDNYFIEFGLDLSSIPSFWATEKFQEWKENKYKETTEIFTIKERVVMRLELAYAYILLAEKDEYAILAWEELDDILYILQNEVDKLGIKEQQKIETKELLQRFENLLTKIENKDD